MYSMYELVENRIFFSSQWSDNMEFFILCVFVSMYPFRFQKQGMKFLSIKILVNIDIERHFDCIFFRHAFTVFRV